MGKHRGTNPWPLAPRKGCLSGWLMISIVLYKEYLSPLLPAGVCRHPEETCSSYALRVAYENRSTRAVCLIIRRLLSCR